MNATPKFFAEVAPTPDEGVCTYLGGGGLVEITIRPGAQVDQLRMAQQFLAGFIAMHTRMHDGSKT